MYKLQYFTNNVFAHTIKIVTKIQFVSNKNSHYNNRKHIFSGKN